MHKPKACVDIDEKLKKLSLIDRVVLFRDIFRYPIDYKDGVYQYGSHEWDETRMSDFLEINMHWLSTNEYERIDYYFKKNKNNS